MRPYRPLPSRSAPNDGNVPYSRARGRPLLQQATLGGTTNSTPGISPVVAAGTNAAGGKCTGRALRLGCCCLGRSCLLPLLGLALVLGCQVLRPQVSRGTHARKRTRMSVSLPVLVARLLAKVFSLCMHHLFEGEDTDVCICSDTWIHR